TTDPPSPILARPVTTRAASSPIRPGTEIILLDAGSADDTVAVARAALAATSLAASILCLERNLGKGGAVRAGVLASAGRVVGFSDADLSAGATEIAKCFAAVESGPAQVVCSSRAMADRLSPVRPPRLRDP